MCLSLQISPLNQNRVCRFFSMCRTMLIRCALDSSDPCALNSGSDVEIRPLRAHLRPFHLKWTSFCRKIRFLSTFFSISTPIVKQPKFQKSWDRPQVVWFWCLNNFRRGEDRNFSAHFDSAPYGTALKVSVNQRNRGGEGRFRNP